MAATFDNLGLHQTTFISQPFTNITLKDQYRAVFSALSNSQTSMLKNDVVYISTWFSGHATFILFFLAAIS
jgi:hypothetical protein